MNTHKIANVFCLIETGLRSRWYQILGKIVKAYLVLHGCSIGTGLKCKQWPIFRTVPWRNISLGNSVTIGYNITFDVAKKGRLVINSKVNLTQDIVISAMSEVYLGDLVQVAENVSIRDADHRFEREALYKNYISEPIRIEDKVGISAGCCIFRGSHLAEGVFIGAMSLTNRKTVTEPYGIYAGIPIKLIGNRP